MVFVVSFFFMTEFRQCGIHTGLFVPNLGLQPMLIQLSQFGVRRARFKPSTTPSQGSRDKHSCNGSGGGDDDIIVGDSTDDD